MISSRVGPACAPDTPRMQQPQPVMSQEQDGDSLLSIPRRGMTIAGDIKTHSQVLLFGLGGNRAVSVPRLHLAAAAVDGPVPAAAAPAVTAGAAPGTVQASPAAASTPHSAAAVRSPPVTLPVEESSQ
jgi:hypothetical protein